MDLHCAWTGGFRPQWQERTNDCTVHRLFVVHHARWDPSIKHQWWITNGFSSVRLTRWKQQQGPSPAQNPKCLNAALIRAPSDSSESGASIPRGIISGAFLLYIISASPQLKRQPRPQQTTGSYRLITDAYYRGREHARYFVTVKNVQRLMNPMIRILWQSHY